MISERQTMPIEYQDDDDQIDSGALQRLEALQRQKMIEMFDFDPEERTQEHAKRKRVRTTKIVAPDPRKKSRTDKIVLASSANESKSEISEEKQKSKSSVTLDDSITFAGDESGIMEKPINSQRLLNFFR